MKYLKVNYKIELIGKSNRCKIYYKIGMNFVWILNPLFKACYRRFCRTIRLVKREIDEPSLNVMGIWDTNFGKLVLIQDKNNVTGYYKKNHGILDGVIHGNILFANWSEQPTYLPPKDAGKAEFMFSLAQFRGKWSYGDSPLFYSWIGKKITSCFVNINCYRYCVLHNSIDLPEILVEDESVSYQQKSSYIYPEDCPFLLELKLYIADKLISKKIPVEPGCSYTFSIQDRLPEISVDVILDNPFK